MQDKNKDIAKRDNALVIVLLNQNKITSVSCSVRQMS